MTKTFDVIVVGGGPAGCAAAVSLARRGVRVGLLERSRFPRDKVCGDALSPASVDVLDRLGMMPAVLAAGAFKITGIRFVSPSWHEVVPRNPSRPGYILKRVVLDEVLFRETQKHPIECCEGARVLGLVKNSLGAVRGVRVRLGDATEETWRADCVIGADGEHSVVKGEVGLKPNPPRHRAFALRYYASDVAGLQHEIMEIFTERTLLPGYAWIFPLAHGEVNVGLGVLSQNLYGKNESLQHHLNDWVSRATQTKRLQGSRVLSKVKGWPLSMATQRMPLAGDGWMLCGDAASMVDPMTGEGIHSALLSGELAAQAIVEQAGRPLCTAGAYERLCRHHFAPHVRLATWLQQYLSVPAIMDRVIHRAGYHPRLAQDLLGVYGSILPCGALLTPRSLWNLAC